MEEGYVLFCERNKRLKKTAIKALILIIIIVISLASCKAKDQEYGYSIKDALKISAYLFDESVEGNVYQEDDAVYTLEQLKLNEVKLMAPMKRAGTWGLTIFLEFEGIIEIAAKDEDVQLSYNNTLTPWYLGESELSGRTYGYNAKFATQGYINANPLSEPIKPDIIQVLHVLKVGTEYYLDVNAYKFNNEETPTIRARLKLVVLEDKNLNKSGKDLEKSHCCSIELVSYDYSDIYKILDEIVDEEDE